MSLLATRHFLKRIGGSNIAIQFPAGTTDFKKNRKPGFLLELNSRTPHEKTWTFSFVLVPETNFGTLLSGKCHDQQATTDIKEFVNALHTVVVKEVANALTLQC
jgi:hypothetical protein